jgi:hypothetical protein
MSETDAYWRGMAAMEGMKHAEIERLNKELSEARTEITHCHATIDGLRAGKNVEFLDVELERLTTALEDRGKELVEEHDEVERLTAFNAKQNEQLNTAIAVIAELRADKVITLAALDEIIKRYETAEDGWPAEDMLGIAREARAKVT